MIYITTLYDLKKWTDNNRHTFPIEKPCVAQWYYDWIFDQVLLFKNYDMFKDAFRAMVDFTVVCEDMSEQKARHLVEDNLRFWHNRASKPHEPFKKYFNRLIVEMYGYMQ